MKKRCTNSSCRRIYNRSMGNCPYCYPTLRVFLKEIGPKRVKIIKIVRNTLDLGLREAKEKVDHGDFIAELPHQKGQKMVQEMRAEGANVVCVSGGKKRWADLQAYSCRHR